MSRQDFRITFVRLQDETRQQLKLMNGVYTLMIKNGYDDFVNWMDEAKLLKQQWNAQDIFIFSKFEGEAFNLLKNAEHRVITPYVIMYCQANFIDRPFCNIPKRNFPIFSQCMRGLFVSTSNLSKTKKKEIADMVSRMSGHYTKDLINARSFLVTDSVLTAKYHLAKQMSIRIVKPDWVYHCDENYQQQIKRADDPEIVKKHEVPIFYGLTICVWDMEHCEEIKKMVQENGGKYSEALNFMKSNTYLLLNETVGERYKYARMNNIPCLRVGWLYDSIKRNIALPVNGYELGPITNQKRNNIESPFVGLIKRNTQTAVFRDVGEFMKNWFIHPVGFDPSTFEALKSSALIFGANVLETCPLFVETIVIVGPRLKTQEASKFTNVYYYKFVTLEWFIECLQKGKICSISEFIYDMHKILPIPSKKMSSSSSKTSTTQNNLVNRSNGQKCISSMQTSGVNALKGSKKTPNSPIQSYMSSLLQTDLPRSYCQPPTAKRKVSFADNILQSKSASDKRQANCSRIDVESELLYPRPTRPTDLPIQW